MPNIENPYGWTHKFTKSLRAKFRFYEKNENGKWETKEMVGVQINPSQLSKSRGYKYKSKVGCNGKVKEKLVQSIPDKKTEQIVRMALYFDLAEAYNSLQYKLLNIGAKTAEITSMVTSLFGYKENAFSKGVKEKIADPINSINDLTLTDPKYTCYPRIKQAVVNEEPVTFYWGNQSYTGKIGEFNSTLSYFSSIGNPLRAKVNIGIYIMDEQQIEKELVINNIVEPKHEGEDETGIELESF